MRVDGGDGEAPRRRWRAAGTGRRAVAATVLAVAVVAGAVVVEVAATVRAASPAAAQAAASIPTFTPDEAVAFLNATDLPGTVPRGSIPPITGNAAADLRIAWRAVLTDYRLRPQAAVPLSGAAGVALTPEATDALLRMRGAAAAAGAPFVAVSGYRSVEDQRRIFLDQLAVRAYQRVGRAYTPNEIAAGIADAAIDDVLRLNSIPGFSFHHTGDAVDLTAPGGSLGAFSGTAAYRWLSADGYANARAHGFLPSYPVGARAIGPEPEPWEFTYVGVGRLQCAKNVIPLADPTPGRCPVGSFDGTVVDGTAVTVSGWAADPDVGPAAIDVHVYAGGRGVAVLRADRSRPDVDAATGLGPNHGFTGRVDLPPGIHQVCAYAVNDAPGEANTVLGCRVVVVRTTPPVGAFDGATGFGPGVAVAGWTADPDLPGVALDVHVYVDGRGAAVLRADRDRPDVAAATGLGAAHGFSGWVRTATGVHDVCAYAISPQPAEGNRLLGCRRAWSLGSTPTGVVDSARGDGRGIVVSGWAVDGDLPDGPLPVHVYVDGMGAGATVADRSRPDVGRALGTGPAHGFEVRVPAAPGPRQVCAYAVAVQPGDPNVLLGCRTVVVVGALPTGALDGARGAAGAVEVAGWAADPDVPSVALDVHVYVDGRGAAVLRAGLERPDVGAATPHGSLHGFSASVTAAPGPHVVCAYAISPEAGEGNPLLGCRAVTVT